MKIAVLLRLTTFTTGTISGFIRIYAQRTKSLKNEKNRAVFRIKERTQERTPPFEWFNIPLFSLQSIVKKALHQSPAVDQ